MTGRAASGMRAGGGEGLGVQAARGALAGVRLVGNGAGSAGAGGGLRGDGERRSAEERRRALAYGRARGRLS